MMLKPHNFPPGKMKGRRCVYCGLKEENEFKKPDCKGTYEGKPGKSAMADEMEAAAFKTPASTKGVKRCFESHPPVDVGAGLTLYGGSCSRPIIEDAHVYIGFDRASMKLTSRSFPWTEGYDVPFPITDMRVPNKPELFIDLVDWTIKMAHEGHKIHGGCIGGHGRTGLWLAAVVAKLAEHDDAISYVREAYCQKAVESEEQIRFLVKHFGCKTAKATKPRTTKATSFGYQSTGADLSKWGSKAGVAKPAKNSLTVSSIPSAKGNVWGE